MSTLLESIGSLFSPFGTNVGLKNMFERCLAARTKAEEKWLVQDCLKLVKIKLAETSTTTPVITKCILFTIFAEMLGYKSEFAYIHAAKLAQKGTLVEKKIGYLACAVLLRPSDPLSVLLVNTILRDLASKNIVVVAMALTACCHLVLVDQLPILIPSVLEKLTHSNEYVRSKAVIAIHYFYRLCPEQCCHYTGQVQNLLSDKDPGVVSLVIQFLLDIIQNKPEKLEDVVNALINIQNQILIGKMPKDYIYHQIPSPWMQMSILRLLRLIGFNSESVKSVIEKTLTAARGSADREEVRGAIISDCVCTMAILENNDDNMASAVELATQYLTSNNSNLRYEGLHQLEVILHHHPTVTLTPSQQNIVMENLQHKDPAMKRKSLSLLCAVATESNARSLCGQLADYALADCANNSYLQEEMVNRAISLIDKFPDFQNYWHVAMLIRLMPLAEGHQSDSIQSKFREALLAGNDDSNTTAIRQKVIKILKKYSESKTASTVVLEAYVWVLGEFFEVNIEESDETCPATKTLTQICQLGLKVVLNLDQDREPSRLVCSLLVAIVQACACVCENSGVSIQLLNDLLQTIKESCIQYALLQDCCLELIQTLPFIKSVHEVLKNCNDLRNGIPVESSFDFTLSFLDEFVCQSLENGEELYWPQIDRSYQSHLVNSGESFTSRPTSSGISSPPTALLQTSSVSSQSGSISELLTNSSTRCEETKPWLTRRSSDEMSARLWTPQGRVKTTSDQPKLFSSIINVSNDDSLENTSLRTDNAIEQAEANNDENKVLPSDRDVFDELIDNNFQQLSIPFSTKNS